jgi:hypothetical protein
MNFKKTYIFTAAIVFTVVVFSCTLLLNGCKNKGRHAYQFTGDTVADGKNLAQINCTKCHSLVPVDALNNDVWQFHTLPAMAQYLGLKSYLGGYYKDDSDTAGLSLVEWQAIVTYYKKMAPVTLPGAKKPAALINDWAGFTLKTPTPINGVSFTTMVAVDPSTHKIYSSDNHSTALLEWDSNLKFKPVSTLPSAAVGATFLKDAAGANQGIFSCIGRLEPMDFPNGRVVNVNLDSKEVRANQKQVASDLARPVQTVAADFNKDGLTDLVICGEGNLKGGVYLFSQKADHSYKQTNISDKPGAVQAVAGDFNNDGWQDLMVLFGSGDEGLWLYLNDQKGGFTTKNLLRFPPVYGSSSFQLADMDHDGKPDLVYTCGYNFHDSRILKPYHGLYIFKNTGDWNFKQQWFYPVNGCTKAIAADFDGDGDLDIATSAFFADMQNNPAESFIYFEQDKPFSFKPHAIPVSKYGRWMSMDVGDYNNDGKPDIVLGNYSSGFMFQPGFKPFWAKDLPLIVLENHTKK